MKRRNFEKNEKWPRPFVPIQGIWAIVALFVIATFFVHGSAYASGAGKKLLIRHAVSFTKEMEDWFETGAWHFADLVSKKSDGAIEVQIFPGGQMGSQVTVAGKVQSGALEFGHSSLGNLSQHLPILNLLDLPYLFPDINTFNRTIRTQGWKNIIHKAAEKKNFKILWYVPSGLRAMGFRKGLGKLVRLPGDLKGLKIRTTAAVTPQKAYKLCGASPTPIAWPETPSAMQQGVVDGLDSSLMALHGAGISSTMESATDVNHLLDCGCHFANLEWYNKLSVDQRRIIEEAADETNDWMVERYAGIFKKIEKVYKDMGITLVKLTSDEREQWKKTIGHQLPVWDDLKKKWGKSTYDSLVKVIKGASQ